VNLSHVSHVVACLAIATGVKTQWHLLAWATPTWRRHHETCVRQKKHVPIFVRPGPSTCIKLPHHLSRHSCIWVGIWDQDDTISVQEALQSTLSTRSYSMIRMISFNCKGRLG
jgi:hypothetical protein